MEKRLYRSQSDRMIAGVCGGLGEYLKVDPVWLRLGFVLMLFAGGGLGFWAYIILWIVVPAEGQSATTPGETVQANVQELAERARELGQGVQRGLNNGRITGEGDPSSGAVVVAMGFILVGVVLLLSRFSLFSWLNWGTLWPLALIFVGGALLFSRIREE
jgi:phage shock protein PspC (stress-responsive transcriptional regulator)